MFFQKKKINYSEYEHFNEGREIGNKEWSNGEDMADIVRERYKKIVKSRYGTWDGLCFIAAGINLICGTTPWIVKQEFSLESALTIFCLSWCLFFCFLGVIMLIRRDRNREMKHIDEGKFYWKMDEVYMLLPDRYPKTSKILIETEAKPVITLQAFFWYKKGDYVYVIKRTENGEMEGFIY